MVTQSYDDILALTDREPQWYDECRVPRFCEFHPSALNSIYAREAALVEVACQVCARLFLVAEKWDLLDYDLDQNNPASRPASERVKAGHIITGGDPPNHGYCNHRVEGEGEEGLETTRERARGYPPCSAGYCMTCDPVRIVQFWERSNFEWVRRPDLEIKFEIKDYGDDE